MSPSPYLQDAFAAAHPQPEMPRFRYFQKRNGPMFSWTTEKYASFVHLPTGKGSRSGKAEVWTLDDETIAAHVLRKDAKARALRLFEEWETAK